MSRVKFLPYFALAALMSTPAYAYQGVSTLSAHAQTTGDINPQEYDRLMEETNRARAFKSAQSNYTTTYNARTDAQSYVQASAQTAQAPSEPYVYYQTTPAPTPQTTTAQPVIPQQNMHQQPQPYAQNPSEFQYQQPQYAPPQPQSQPQPIAQPPQQYAGIARSHFVQKGDTLYNLSKRYGTTVGAIRSVNGLQNNLIRIGQTIAIPGPAQIQPTSANYRYPAQYPYVYNQSRPLQNQTFVPQTGQVVYQNTPTQVQTRQVRSELPVPSSRVYAVLPNDTLYSIAEFACVNPSDLAVLNKITNFSSPLILGQRLVVPANHCLG